MSYHLMDFQQSVKNEVYKEWNNGARCVMPVLPTGAGKTVIMGNIAHEHQGAGCSTAHRSELLGQMSIALAREGVRHDIIAPKATIKTIVNGHMEEVGRSYYDPRSQWKAASVDTLLRRQLDPRWVQQVTLVFQDEGHHVLRDNKWGRAFEMFPNARGLFPTATPERADGRGLGRDADGLVDVLVEGPDMRWLIDQGYLTDYRILAPTPRDFTMDGVTISPTTGDYNAEQMRTRVKSSTRIIGDVVETYLTHAAGKLGITFAVDVEHATQIANEYNARGVPALVVHADTPEVERRMAMHRFKRREILQLVNVDLFGEGVDVPAVEVISMARPTASYGLFVQQFGRTLRLLVSPILRAAWHTYSAEERKAHIAASGKPFGLVIDHVGNIIKHFGPPDWRKTPWTLEARTKRNAPTDTIPLRACTNVTCLQVYERYLPRCPMCDTEPPPPAERSKPEHVDGDIVLYTPEMLEELFGAKNNIDGPCYVPRDVSPMVATAIRAKHKTRQEAQQQLRATMQLVLPPDREERTNNRKFFYEYGVDVLTAQTLGAPDANELRNKIIAKIGGNNDERS